MVKEVIYVTHRYVPHCESASSALQWRKSGKTHYRQVDGASIGLKPVQKQPELIVNVYVGLFHGSFVVVSTGDRPIM